MSNAGIPPVDIEFVVKNTDFSAATKEVKKEIIDVGVTAEKVSKQVEDDLVNSLNNAGKAAQGVNSKFGQSTAGVQQFGKGMNQLSFSMQQVARELPSLAISPQMFFLAISNNLPILQDQIRKTRLENEALKASGQSAVPVWKQLASSLFSWNTAIVAGITILTVYGKEIFAWAKNLVSVRREIELTRKEIKELTKDFASSLGTELGKANQLFTTLEKSQKGTAEYYKAKRAIIDQYGDYLKGLDAEITMLNNVEGAYRAVTEALKEQARQKVITETQSKETAKVVEQEAKSYQKISDAFNAKFGTKIGGFKFEQFRKEFEAGKGFSLEMKRIIDSFTTATPQVIGSSVTGFTQTITTDVNVVRDAINGITQAQTDAQQKIQQVQNLFGKITSGQTSQITSLIQKQRDELAIAKLMPEATEAEIKAKNQKIEVIEKEIDRLEKLGKAGKDGDYQKQLMAELEAAVKSGSQTAIDEAAKRIAIYEQEKDLLRQIIELAAFEMKYADQHKNIAPMQSKGIESVDKGDIKNIDSPNGRKILYEVTAINKTGPVWKKIGLESDKLKKLIVANAKEADRLQKEIDEDELERKQKLYADIVNAAQMFTFEMLQQLDLTKEQEELLNGIASTLTQLAQGNLMGAAASFLSTIVKGIASTKDLTPEEVNERQLESINKSVSRTNELLDYQLNILAGLDGSDWFSSAVKNLAELNQELSAAKRKLEQITVYSTDRGKQKIDTSKWTQEQWMKALNQTDKGEFSFDGLEEGAQQYLDLWIEIENKIKTIENEQKSRMLGFNETDIASGIADGILNGLKVAENGLGGFAESFGNLMEAYGKKSLETFLNEKYLKDLYAKAFEMADDEDGLSDIDLQELERLYTEAAKGGQEYYDRISKLFSFGETPGQNALTGIERSLTEDTGSLLAGLFTALRIDVKEILKNMAAADNDTVQKLSYLKEIAENTRHNVRLKGIEEGIAKTNKLLDERL